MNSAVTCNYCNEMFLVDRKDVVTKTDGDLEIQYFACPKCHRKFLVMATDPEMRKLIAMRQQIATQIKMARVAKAGPKTFQRLARELELVAQAQKRKLPEMKRRGWAALTKEVDDDAEK